MTNNDDKFNTSLYDSIMADKAKCPRCREVVPRVLITRVGKGRNNPSLCVYCGMKLIGMLVDSEYEFCDDMEDTPPIPIRRGSGSKDFDV